MAGTAQAEYAVMYFTADWCHYCKEMKPSWEHKEVRKVLRDNEIGLYEVDVDKKKSIADDYGVTSMPTTIVIKVNDEKKGEVLAKQTGAMSGTRLAEFIRKAISK